MPGASSFSSRTLLDRVPDRSIISHYKGGPMACKKSGVKKPAKKIAKKKTKK